MNPEIVSLSKLFHFGVISRNKYVVPEDLYGEELILNLFRAEAKSREDRAAADRLKQAKLPAEKKFETFDTDFQKGITAREVEILAKLEWLDSLYNLILIGPPGTGKTHLALAIGSKAVKLGVKTAFTSMDNLVHILKTQEISTKSQNRLRYLKKCELLIIDEFGYLPVSKTEANFFFSLISELYEKASIVITSNKGFEGWADVLGDSILATALLDRLTHRCQIINLIGEGWRVAHRTQIFT